MKDIIIFGSGGLALEIEFLITQINEYKSRFKVLGFVDNKETQEIIDIGEKRYSIINENDISENNHYRGTSAVMGIGNPIIIRSIAKKFDNILEWPNIVHPNAIIDPTIVQMGYGNVITAGCVFTSQIEIGSFNIINLTSTIGHDCKIGSCNVINPGSNVSGGVNIGSGNLIGTNSTILQYLNIGNNCVLGAGSLLLKSIPDDEIWVGNPAKKLKNNAK